MFGVNMAVPFKENIRESRIYILSGSENAPLQQQPVNKKFIVFKIIELIISLCALMLFAYSLRATENVIDDTLKYIIIAGVTIYPLVYILFASSLNQRPMLSIVLNMSATFILLFIGVINSVDSWAKVKNLLHNEEKEKYYSELMILRSAFFTLIAACLYLTETLAMSVDIWCQLCK